MKRFSFLAYYLVAFALALPLLVPRVVRAQNTPTNTPANTSTFTPTNTNTPTVTYTPVPNVSGHAKIVRNLDHLGASTGPAVNLGQRLAALWHGRQSGGALTAVATPTSAYNIAAGQYMVNGVPVPAATATVGPSLAGITTDGTHYRKVAICIEVTGTYTVVAGVAATGSQAAALKPNCADYAAEVGYLELPISFTGDSTSVTAGMCKQTALAASGLGHL